MEQDSKEGDQGSTRSPEEMNTNIPSHQLFCPPNVECTQETGPDRNVIIDEDEKEYPSFDSEKQASTPEISPHGTSKSTRNNDLDEDARFVCNICLDPGNMVWSTVYEICNLHEIEIYSHDV